MRALEAAQAYASKSFGARLRHFELPADVTVIAYLPSQVVDQFVSRVARYEGVSQSDTYIRLRLEAMQQSD